MYKPRYTKIRDFIWYIDEMVEYLEKFPPFGEGQRVPYDEILNMVEFSLLKKWQKELIIQGFDSANQCLMDIFEFCERLETAEKIFQMQGEGNHQTKKTKQSGERHQSAKLAQNKGSNRSANQLEKDANKKKKKKKKSLVCPMHGPGNYMNSCKVILAQAKAMKSTWSTSCGGVAGRVRFQGAKKRPPEGEERDDIVANKLKSVLNTNKCLTANASIESRS